MATTIKEILDSLEPAERDAINYAFGCGVTYFVILPGDRFIGVNVETVAHLYPDVALSRGVWSVGRIGKQVISG